MKKEDNFKHKQNEEDIKEDIAEEKCEDAVETKCDIIEKLQEDNAKLKDDYLRTLADMENLKKRCATEIEKNTKYAVADFAKSLLNVADNLQRALDAVGQDRQNDSMSNFVKGIELTQSELNKVFAKFGIKKMEIMGTVFNPNFHQVVQEIVDNEKENGTVVAEIQTGYMIGDRILREAMVVVSKKSV